MAEDTKVTPVGSRRKTQGSERLISLPKVTQLSDKLALCPGYVTQKDYDLAQ